MRRLCTSTELALAWALLEGSELTRPSAQTLPVCMVCCGLPWRRPWIPGRRLLPGSGILSQLPFHAMYRPGPDGARRYVMDRHALIPLSTTRTIAENVHQNPGGVSGSLVGLGGVDYNTIPTSKSGGQSIQKHHSPPRPLLPRIPVVLRRSCRSAIMVARVELEDISASWRDAGMQVDQLGGSAASEHALKARLEEEVPAVLHIATHGFAFLIRSRRRTSGRSTSRSSAPTSGWG